MGTLDRARRARTSAGLAALVLAAAGLSACTTPPPGGGGGGGGGGGTPGACAPVEIITARGTGESQTNALGLAGLNRGIAAGTQAVIYQVEYPASTNFGASSAAGTADALARLQTRAAACPDMRFFITGYSQGGMVATGVFRQLPAGVAGRVVGGVTYGNPFYNGSSPTAAGPDFSARGISGGAGIPASWGGKVREYCNVGDTVCGSSGSSGGGGSAHLAYPRSALEREATAWAVSLINGG